MEPEKIILIFLKWLAENPSIFLPTAWQDLPQLETKIAESADDELFPLAMTISKWCAYHGLGETLKQDAAKLKKEIEDAGEPTPTTMQPLTNITQTLRQSIEEASRKIQKLEAENQSYTDNDSKQ